MLFKIKKKGGKKQKEFGELRQARRTDRVAGNGRDAPFLHLRGFITLLFIFLFIWIGFCRPFS